MMRHTPGKMYLAEQRGLAESAQHRRYSTFSFGSFQHEHKGAFGGLFGLNEETLATSHSLELVAEQASHLLVIPITGGVKVTASPGYAALVHVEEIQLLTLPAQSTVQFTNPYDTELISFLHLWLTAEPEASFSDHIYTFEAPEIANTLTEVVAAEVGSALPFSLSLGRFAGRHEAIHTLRGANRQLFVFVLAGAFEVAGRLLHEKDGLALWETSEIELEALSENALVLVLDM
ncbi:pirin family protein [Hymenobacter seoulensis]